MKYVCQHRNGGAFVFFKTYQKKVFVRGERVTDHTYVMLKCIDCDELKEINLSN